VTLGDKTRCDPLTLTDAATRYLLKCQTLAKTDEAPVRAELERTFREFGLPKKIRSDNGPPFAGPRSPINPSAFVRPMKTSGRSSTALSSSATSSCATTSHESSRFDDDRSASDCVGA
jgi:hypothetical protein